MTQPPDRKDAESLPTIGWREWLELPELASVPIKAKIDTGARSSSLHAVNIKKLVEDGKEYVEFDTFPAASRKQNHMRCHSLIHDIREVRSSNGVATPRIVIVTPVRWKGEQWDVELTLADRSMMKFQMLLGREAVRRRLLVNPGASFLGGRYRKRRSS